MAGAKARARLPLQPLLDAAHIEAVSLPRRIDARWDRVNSYAEIGIPEYTADMWACRLGFHPSSVWGDLWWETAFAVEQCKHGHERTVENTRIDPDGSRACRTCDNIRKLARPSRSGAEGRRRAKERLAAKQERSAA